MSSEGKANLKNPPGGRKKRVLFALLLLIPAIVIILSIVKSKHPPGQSIVLITIDTLRADRLGCYGYGRKTSPNIDSLARRSVLFETALTPRTKTAPAIASILTGLYPHTHGVRTNWTKLPEKIPTLPEILRENGYRTAAVVGNFILRGENSGLDRGFEFYDDRMTDKELNRGFQEKTAGKVNEAVFAWLDRNQRDRFFLWVHYQDPHGPYTAPPGCRAVFSHWKIPAGLPDCPVGNGTEGTGGGRFPTGLLDFGGGFNRPPPPADPTLNLSGTSPRPGLSRRISGNPRAPSACS